MSAERDGNSYVIDAAELFRVFAPKPSNGTKENAEKQAGETAKDVEIRMLRELIHAKEELIEELRADKLRLQASQPSQGFWSRLLGR